MKRHHCTHEPNEHCDNPLLESAAQEVADKDGLSVSEADAAFYKAEDRHIYLQRFGVQPKHVCPDAFAHGLELALQ